MLMPSIFGEDLFDDWMNDYFPFGKDFDKEFSKALAPTERALYGKHAKNMMKTDVRETDDAYEVDIDLPGFKKEDINIDIDKDCLTISAERKSEEKEDKGDNGFVRRERYYGSFSRSFNIKGIDTDAITAEYNDGVLTLTMPEKTPEVPAARRLEIK